MTFCIISSRYTTCHTSMGTFGLFPIYAPHNDCYKIPTSWYNTTPQLINGRQVVRTCGGQTTKLICEDVHKGKVKHWGRDRWLIFFNLFFTWKMLYFGHNPFVPKGLINMIATGSEKKQRCVLEMSGCSAIWPSPAETLARRQSNVKEMCCIIQSRGFHEISRERVVKRLIA